MRCHTWKQTVISLKLEAFFRAETANPASLKADIDECPVERARLTAKADDATVNNTAMAGRSSAKGDTGLEITRDHCASADSTGGCNTLETA
jgi:hypothetical protein